MDEYCTGSNKITEFLFYKFFFIIAGKCNRKWKWNQLSVPLDAREIGTVESEWDVEKTRAPGSLMLP